MKGIGVGCGGGDDEIQGGEMDVECWEFIESDVCV